MNTFSDPIKIIEQFPVDNVHAVADFGAGGGAYSLALARKYSSDITFKIYSIEVVQDLLAKIDSTAKAESLSNINVVWGDIENEKGSRLRDNSIDLVLIINVLFLLEDRNSIMKEAHRVLRSGGHIVVIDWTDSFGNIGPKEESIISFDSAKQLAEQNAFIFEKDIEAGNHHYGFISKKI